LEFADRDGYIGVSDVPLEIGMEEVLPRFPGSRARLQLGQAQVMFGQNREAAEQRSLLVSRGEDQRRFRGYPQVARLGPAGHDGHAGEVLPIVRDAAFEDNQAVDSRRFFARDRSLRDVTVLAHPPRRHGGVGEGLDLAPAESLQESPTLGQRDRVGEDPPDARERDLGQGHEAVIDFLDLFAHDGEVQTREQVVVGCDRARG